MAATATVERPKTAPETTLPEVVKVLGDGEMYVADLLEKVGMQAMSTAWGSELIEFGRRQHVVCGNLQRWDSYYLLEDGMVWTEPPGPRERRQTFRELWDTEKTLFPMDVPDGDGRRMVSYRDALLPRVTSTVLPFGFDPGSQIKYTMPAPISYEKAMESLKLKVRLTGKGLDRLQG